MTEIKEKQVLEGTLETYLTYRDGTPRFITFHEPFPNIQNQYHVSFNSHRYIVTVTDKNCNVLYEGRQTLAVNNTDELRVEFEDAAKKYVIRVKKVGLWQHIKFDEMSPVILTEI